MKDSNDHSTLTRKQIRDYIREFYKDMPHIYNSEHFDFHIDFFLDDSRAAIRIDKDDNIIDVGLARTIFLVEQITDQLYHREGGHILVIDFLKLTTHDGARWLLQKCKERFPLVKFIAFQRMLKGDTRVHLISFERAERLLTLMGEK